MIHRDDASLQLGSTYIGTQHPLGHPLCRRVTLPRPMPPPVCRGRMRTLSARLVQLPASAALVVYLAAALLMFGTVLVHPAARRCLCHIKDVGPYTWALAWWPHAITDGLDPLHSSLISAPQGLDLALGTPVPAAALVLWPVTALAGPLYAYNVGMLLAPALSAFFAFLLCRRVCGDFWPALVGGWIFGFSTYMFGQLIGHMNLTMMLMVPAIVHVVLRGVALELRTRRFIGLLGLTLLVQAALSVEVLVTVTLSGAVALALAYILGDGVLRAQVRAAVRPIVLAYVGVAVLASPYLYESLAPGGLPILPKRDNNFSADLLSFVVPTRVTAIGGAHFQSTSARFSAGFVEGGAYLGLPLLAMIALSAVRLRRSVGVRVAIGTLLVLFVFSLGGRLQLDGPTQVPLPWALVTHLPILGLILPVRFVAYIFLITAVLAALLLAQTRRFMSSALGALVIASLWPALGSGLWNSRPPLPALFTDAAYRSVLSARDTVFAPPVGSKGLSMLWQAEAGLRFAVAGGYFLAPEAGDPYSREAIYPTLRLGLPVPNQERAAAAFLRRHGVTVAVIDPALPEARPWPGILTRLGWHGHRIGGTIVMRPPREQRCGLCGNPERRGGAARQMELLFNRRKSVTLQLTTADLSPTGQSRSTRPFARRAVATPKPPL